MTLRNFLVGVPAMLLCLVVQVAVVFWCVRYYVRHPSPVGSGQASWRAIRPLVVAMLAMMVANLLQIVLWGGLFVWLGEFEEVYDGDLPLGGELHVARLRRRRHEREWKLLGPLEAANGVLMMWHERGGADGDPAAHDQDAGRGGTGVAL